MTHKRPIDPGRLSWREPAPAGASIAVDLGSAAIVAGRSALETEAASGRTIARGDLREQARVAYARLAEVLRAAGRQPGEIVQVVEYVASRAMDEVSHLAGARREQLGTTATAVSTVCVDRLVHLEVLVEVEAIASAAPERSGATVAAPWRDLVFLPALLPVDGSGAILAGEDFMAQARAVFARAGVLLEKAGLGWSNVVKQVNYITPAARPHYRQIVDVRREHLGPVFPAATAVVVERLPHPDALIQVELIASRHLPAAIDTGWKRSSTTSSLAARAGDLIFISGQTALDHATGETGPAGDVAGQAARTYAKLLEILRSAGASAGDLVKTVEYVTQRGIGRYAEVAAARAAGLESPFPATTSIVCQRLLGEDSLIEIDAVAVVPAPASEGRSS